jgi:hypothetical protein
MIKLPQFPIEGGCACGQVRYRLTEAPLAIYTCHCSDCQTLSTSAFTLTMPVRPEALEIIKGTLRTWIRVPPSGNQLPQHVCPNCGVRIYSEPAHARSKSLRCGTLDDTSWIEPVAAIWMRSAQPWVRMPEGCLLYETDGDFPGEIIPRFKSLITPSSSDEA